MRTPKQTKKVLQSMPNYSIDLIKQMAECDANYIRLLKLVPQLRAHREKSFSAYVEPYCVSENKTLVNSPEEPEKVLEGLVTEFCIADLEDSNLKVTVEIKILEAFKYTTTLEIVQRPEFKKWMTNPSMLVRVYHDASTAEVISYQGHRNLKSKYSQPNSKMYHTDEKMQVNSFLGEWLTYCIKVGRSTKTPGLMFTL